MQHTVLRWLKAVEIAGFDCGDMGANSDQVPERDRHAEDQQEDAKCNGGEPGNLAAAGE